MDFDRTEIHFYAKCSTRISVSWTKVGNSEKTAEKDLGLDRLRTKTGEEEALQVHKSTLQAGMKEVTGKNKKSRGCLLSFFYLSFYFF